MKKLILSALFLSAIGSANATTTIRVICCDGSVHDFYGIGEEAYSKYLKKPGSYEMYLMDAAKGYCPEDCIRSVFELKGSTLSVSAQTGKNEQTATWVVENMADNVQGHEQIPQL